MALLEEPRPLTDLEKSWVIRAIEEKTSYGRIAWSRDGRDIGKKVLQHRQLSGSVQEDLKAQIDGLRVVDVCGCGNPRCHSVTFREHRPEEVVYSLVSESVTDDGELIFLFWDADHKITELEVIG